MFDFEIKIAQNKQEIREALRLRYEVFKIEMDSGPGHKDEFGLDTDIYDDLSDHLIVIDKVTNKVVGTYRLLLGSRMGDDMKYYSERFFDISNIKKLAAEHQILELGRSCIHKDYRSRAVINLLWSGIAKYINDHGVRFLFGSVRLLTHDPAEVSLIFKFLQERFYAAEEFRVYPLAQNRFKGLKKNIIVENPRILFRKLPALVKGYLRVGVKVCGFPAVNRDLNSIVLFILLDTERMSHLYKQHFF
jgi:putative hemolysin